MVKSMLKGNGKQKIQNKPSQQSDTYVISF